MPLEGPDAERALEQSPVGGGESVTPRYTREDADVVVSETSEFLRADRNDIVYIADGETVQVSDEAFNCSGTALIGGRHKPGVEPGTVDVRTSGPGSAANRGAIRGDSGDWYVEGIRILGPHWDESKADGYYQDRLSPKPVEEWPGALLYSYDMSSSRRADFRSDNLSRGINAYGSGEAKNIEVAGFSHAGISIGSKSHTPQVIVTHSDLHNCAMPGYGYSVNHFNGDFLSRYNHYDAARHTITGFGWPSCGYSCQYDVHGPNAMLTPVDMHNLAENRQTGITAGGYLDVERCTFLAERRPATPTWYGASSCPAIGIRGHPAEGHPGYTTTDCQFVHSSESAALDQRNVSFPTGWERDGNEYGGLENWSDGKGAPVDWGATEPEPEPEPEPEKPNQGVEKRRAQARATSRRLGGLEAAMQAD